MTLAYVANLGLTAQKTYISTQKIDGFILVTYEIVIIGFSIKYKLEIVWFFEETFLLANNSIEVILEMFFLIFSNANIRFAKKELE